jgi:hypothetical protein
MGLHSQLNGTDLHSPSREWIENTTGATLLKLHCVKYTGIGTHFPTIGYSIPISDIVRGITTDDIPDGKVGTICVIGWIQRIDTSAWADGAKLYCSAGGNLSDVVAGLPVAVVVKSHATLGVLYVDSQGVTSSDIAASVGAFSWSLSGNDSSLHPFPLQLGTIDAASVPVITNNTQRLLITDIGRIGIGDVQPMAGLHIKFHPAFPQSGKMFDTFTLSTNSTTQTTGYAFTLPSYSVATFTVTLTARTADGTQKAVIKKTASFCKDAPAGNVQQLKSTQTDYMIRDLRFQLDFKKTSTSVQVKVTAPDTTVTNWHGTVELDLFTETAPL